MHDISDLFTCMQKQTCNLIYHENYNEKQHLGQIVLLLSTYQWKLQNTALATRCKEVQGQLSSIEEQLNSTKTKLEVSTREYM